MKKAFNQFVQNRGRTKLICVILCVILLYMNIVTVVPLYAIGTSFMLVFAYIALDVLLITTLTVLLLKL